MKTNINISLENQKKYQTILNNLINSKFSNKTIESIYSIDMKNEFLNYFQMNIKKSSFKAQILPSIAFFLVSLVSFSVEVLIKNNLNFGVEDNINNFRVCNLVFGAFFFSSFVGCCVPHSSQNNASSSNSTPQFTHFLLITSFPFSNDIYYIIWVPHLLQNFLPALILLLQLGQRSSAV